MTIRIPALCAALLLALSIAAPAGGTTRGAAEQLPNLVPLAPYGIHLGDADDGSGRALRFTTAFANRGDYSLDVLAHDTDPDLQTAIASQCVQWAAPRDCTAREDVGRFVVHPEHGHAHFEDYALYELRRLDAASEPDLSPAGLVATSGKVSFCLLDAEHDRPPPDPAYTERFYNCAATAEGVQGISASWRDIYTSGLVGQQVDLDGVVDGSYALVVTVNPAAALRETTVADNVSFAVVHLRGAALTVARRFGGDGSPRRVPIDICQALYPFPDSGATVVLARDDLYADALAGAPLAGDACILTTAGGSGQALDPDTRYELDRVLPVGARVQLLGGVDAVSSAVEAELVAAGYAVERFAGASRVETAVAIAERVHAEHPEVTDALLASAADFPDAITGGAFGARTGTPILLTEPGTLHPATDAALERFGVSRTWVLGGAAAITDAAAASAPGSVRVAGDNRMGTAAAVARTLWGTEAEPLANVVVANLDRPDSWALALAAAPLSARLGAPQLGVRADSYPAETAGYLGTLSATERVLVIGDAAVISDGVAVAAIEDAA